MRIVRDGQSFEVTKGAFKSLFEPYGFTPEIASDAFSESEGEITPSDEEKPLPHENSSNDSPESAELEDSETEKPEEIEEEPEKPLSEMSFSELLEYADSLGMDTEGVRNEKELRKLISTAKD